MSHEEEQIKATVHAFVDAWRAVDMDAVMQCWDPAPADDLSFVICESDEFLFGRSAVRAYFEAAARSVRLTGAEVSNIGVRILSEDAAYAICLFKWTVEANGQEFVTNLRGSLVLRKRAKRWYFQHMHESMKWTLPV
jgi:uncharacterized protein (TIGR02246 family)